MAKIRLEPGAILVNFGKFSFSAASKFWSGCFALQNTWGSSSTYHPEYDLRGTRWCPKTKHFFSWIWSKSGIWPRPFWPNPRLVLEILTDPQHTFDSSPTPSKPLSAPDIHFLVTLLLSLSAIAWFWSKNDFIKFWNRPSWILIWVVPVFLLMCSMTLMLSLTGRPISYGLSKYIFDDPCFLIKKCFWSKSVWSGF